MTASTVTAAPARLGSLLAAPFRAIWNFMILLADASPRMRALQKLSQISDKELARRGLTRDGEMRRILGASACI